MSRKRSAQSEAAEQLDKEQWRQNNDNYFNMWPGCSKREGSTVNEEREQTAVAATSNTATASMAPPQLPMSVEQTPHSDHQIQSQDREDSHLNFQPIITEVRSIKEADNDDYNEPYVSHHLPATEKMTARLYSHMKDKPSLTPMHEPIAMRIPLADTSGIKFYRLDKTITTTQTKRPIVIQNSNINIIFKPRNSSAAASKVRSLETASCSSQQYERELFGSDDQLPKLIRMQ